MLRSMKRRAHSIQLGALLVVGPLAFGCSHRSETVSDVPTSPMTTTGASKQPVAPQASGRQLDAEQQKTVEMEQKR